MGPYPLELRQRVIDAYEDGEGSLREIAEQFHVSLHFVKDMRAKYLKQGHLAPQPHGGGVEPRLDARRREQLRAEVERHNDATLAELATWLAREQRVVVSIPVLSRTLKAMGLSRKRRPSGQTSGSARRLSQPAKRSAKRSSTSTRDGLSSSMSSGSTRR